MGMGEPFLNYDASIEAIRRLTSPAGLRLGQRRITVSTVGIAPAILRFATEGLDVRLAVSLHAATDALRDQLVPINRRYPLDTVVEACQAYSERTGRRVSFEWALIDGVNDDPDQARALASRIADINAHVNLIPLNPVAGYAGRQSLAQRIDQFTAELARERIPHSVRARRGVDIQAGCGQLASER
jgi:23S rRNA (adenine2503-C2)-methyltransferase